MHYQAVVRAGAAAGGIRLAADKCLSRFRYALTSGVGLADAASDDNIAVILSQTNADNIDSLPLRHQPECSVRVRYWSLRISISRLQQLASM